MRHGHLSLANLRVDGLDYHVRVARPIVERQQAPRLVVVSYLPNQQTRDILRVCVETIQAHTPEAHELWIVDNNSPKESIEWLLQWSGLNLALNRTEPVPPEHRRLLLNWVSHRSQLAWGSYANAVALELAVRLLDPGSRYLMTLHMDTMPCHPGWLSFLQNKLDNKTKAAGVRMDTARTPEGVLHVLGYLVDFQLFRQLELSFLPSLPQYDVGDRVTVALRAAGYSVFACHNTLWEPELVDTIPLSSPFRHLSVDRSFDDSGNLIFLHLGRGVRKTSGEHTTGTMPEDWIRFAQEHLLIGVSQNN